jgi:uncharacterized protein
VKQEYKPGQKVELIILRETDLGFVARINGVDEGLLYRNEIFEALRPGQELPGYINRVRERGEIDLILQPFGNLGTEELGEKILQLLDDELGFLPVNDHSPAEEIYDLFGVSKKKFKMALGSLYKKRLITITEKGIKLVRKSP